MERCRINILLQPLFQQAASFYGTVLDISRNSTQTGAVSLFFLLCVWCGSWVSCERVLLGAPGWCMGCLRCAAAACPHALLLRGDAPNLVPPVLGEPDVAIRPGRGAERPAPLRRAVALGGTDAGRDAAMTASVACR